MSRRDDRGFTLLELLAAVTVFGLIAVMVAQGAQFGLRATLAQTLFRDRHADLEVADRALRRLIAQADPGVYPDPATLRGTPAALSLTTRLPLSAGGLPVDAALAVEAGRLVMRWTPHAHDEPFGPPPPPQITVILDQVARVEFAYAAGGAWQPAWQADTLPRLVRITLTLGGGRRWPTMVVATLREPVEQ